MVEPVPLRVIPVAVTVSELPTLLWLKVAAEAEQVTPAGAGLSVQEVTVAAVVPSYVLLDAVTLAVRISGVTVSDNGNEVKAGESEVAVTWRGPTPVPDTVRGAAPDTAATAVSPPSVPVPEASAKVMFPV